MPRDGDRMDAARALVEGFDLPGLRKARVLPPDDDFMPVISYPSQNLVPAARFENLFPDGRLRAALPAALYVHVPFCAFGCHYCHWVKTIGPAPAVMDDYLDHLEVELDLACRLLGLDRIPVSSILLGGGTPTYLDPARLDRLLEMLLRRVDTGPCRQFSIEAEPGSLAGDLGPARLATLRAHGVDRVSLGVQSFEDTVLARMGRHHGGDDARRAIDRCRDAGIDSVSLDLIYGYPGQSDDDWLRTLQSALDSGADAWHLYRLRIRRHGDVQGAIGDQRARQAAAFPELQRIYRMKALGWVFSEEHGRDQHFTRIFATHHRHVTQYMWDYCCRLADVVGFGPSSWGAYGPIFTLNAGGPQSDWARALDEGRLPMDRGIARDPETEARRCLVIPLKNDRVIRSAYRERLGFDAAERFAPELARLEALGLLRVDDDSICLTRRGRFVADETVMQLFQKRYLLLSGVEHDLMPD
jgi:oxygen-independent coproporphyrinogen III oxidase